MTEFKAEAADRYNCPHCTETTLSPKQYVWHFIRMHRDHIHGEECRDVAHRLAQRRPVERCELVGFVFYTTREASRHRHPSHPWRRYDRR